MRLVGKWIKLPAASAKMQGAVTHLEIVELRNLDLGRVAIAFSNGN
jgi:hypothetical protein